MCAKWTALLVVDDGVNLFHERQRRLIFLRAQRVQVDHDIVSVHYLVQNFYKIRYGLQRNGTERLTGITTVVVINLGGRFQPVGQKQHRCMEWQ